MVMGGLENVATMHPAYPESHTPRNSLTSARKDLLVFGDGRESHGAGHYHETYEKQDGSRRIKSLHLTRTIPRSGSGGD